MHEQQKVLNAKLRGHFQYYGIRSNHASLQAYYEQAQHAWRSWLNRRGGKKRMTFARFKELRGVFPLLTPRIIHSI